MRASLSGGVNGNPNDGLGAAPWLEVRHPVADRLMGRPRAAVEVTDMVSQDVVPAATRKRPIPLRAYRGDGADNVVV